MSTSAYELLQVVLKTERARILSSLIRTCGGDFDLAEEALHDAVVAAEHAYQRAIELAGNDPEREKRR